MKYPTKFPYLPTAVILTGVALTVWSGWGDGEIIEKNNENQEISFDKSQEVDPITTSAIGIKPIQLKKHRTGKRGSSTGLPLPRFVSLKSSTVNVRVGPGEQYRVSWIYKKSSLPVEVIEEYDHWRRIKDSEGSEGWVFHSLLTGKRTAIISPWSAKDYFTLTAGPRHEASEVAKLEAGVLATIDQCQANWCRLKGNGYSGWIQKNQIWGVYSDEIIKK